MKIAFYHYPEGKPWYQVLHHLLVSWWTNGPYTHIEVILEEKGKGVYTCGSSSARDGGVRVKNMSLPVSKWDIIEFDSTPNDLLKAKKFFEENSGRKYDYLAWLGFLFRVYKGERKKIFCSEAALSSVGFIQTWRYDPNSMVPLILRLPGAKFVQKGNKIINEY